MRILNLLALLAVPAILTAPTGQAAQNKFPEKPIRLIVGSAAGSGPDIIGRMMAERLYETWKQRVVVDARPGAAGAISADLALGAAADGYTWMMLTSQLFVASQVLADIKFDLARDFQSLSLIGTTPFVLLANNQLPAKSLKELIELAKKQPGKLRYGSAGTGASEHLSGVLLNHLTGTNMLHVPYKGVPAAMTDVMGGQVQAMLTDLLAAVPQVKAGKLAGLAVAADKRSPTLPDMPTFEEASGTKFVSRSWFGILVRSGTPPEIHKMLATEIAKALHRPDVKEKLATLGLDTYGTTPEEFAAFMKSESDRFADAIRFSGTKIE